jgi:outer membrane murein-binding lipoprotein Lpp
MFKNNKVAIAIILGLYLLAGTLDYAAQDKLEALRSEVQA